MDNLPEHVTRILLEATKDRNLTSWRIFGEYNLQVTLKFTALNSEADQYGNIDAGSKHDIHYRSKPQSAVERDIARSMAYRQRSDTIYNNSEHVDIGYSTLSPQQSKDYDNSYLCSTHIHTSGIGQANNHNDLPAFSTPNIPQATTAMSQTSNHNGINVETMCSVDIDQHATQTDMPSHSVTSVQTEKAKSRKLQTMNFNTQFKRSQTLPIATMEHSTQSENICSHPAETMTINPMTQHAMTNTEHSQGKHIQTHQVTCCDIGVGPSVTAHTTQTKKTTKCKEVQVNTKYTPAIPLQGTSGSEVWVESAMNDILNEMTDGLDFLNFDCDKHS